VSVADVFSRDYPARPEAVAAARRDTARRARELRVDPARLADLALAVSEAVTNVVLHAYRSGPPGLVRLEVSREGEEVHVTVSDQGGGMRPRPDSPGLGLGLPLIARLTASLEVSTGERGGTTLCMTFPLGDRTMAA
jgi:serine/threonine-protein kinase RsbW/stage II sporulation protein AB (anti-sigma F factor)